MEKTYCIIGTSAAGLSAAKTILRTDSTASVLCISDEQEQPYNKCFLVDYLAGHNEYARLHTLQDDLATNSRFKLLLGKKVVSVYSSSKSLQLHDGTTLFYDKLLMSMGCSARILPLFQNNPCNGVFAFYTLADMNRIFSYGEMYTIKHAVVIGAGFSGLECAHALTLRGYQVTLIERSLRLLPLYTDEAGSQMIQEAAHKMAIVVKTATTVTGIDRRADGRVAALCLDDGTRIDADLVITAIGNTVNNQLAIQANILLSGQHVVVNEGMQTNQESIFAAGDLVVSPCLATGMLTPTTTWADAVLQGMIAGYAMAGLPRAYQGVVGYTVSHFFGLDVATCGTFGLQQRTAMHSSGGYRMFQLSEDRLQAFTLLGSIEGASTFYRRAFVTKQVVSEQDFVDL